MALFLFMCVSFFMERTVRKCPRSVLVADIPILDETCSLGSSPEPPGELPAAPYVSSSLGCCCSCGIRSGTSSRPIQSENPFTQKNIITDSTKKEMKSHLISFSHRSIKFLLFSRSISSAGLRMPCRVLLRLLPSRELCHGSRRVPVP